MVWHDETGKPFFVFPAQRWGNLLFAPQPTRGWDQDIEAVYHDVTLPPHHQYLAFYLWLQKSFQADAMVHVGTHATHEWLPGKEVGYTAADTGEVIVGTVPQLYPYIVDDIGEGLQAKRRAMATIITHLPPPLDRATINPELREISGLHQRLPRRPRKKARLPAMTRSRDRATLRKTGLFKDLGITLAPKAQLNKEQLEEIDDHIEKIGEKLTPLECTRSAWRPMRQNAPPPPRRFFARTKSLARRACAAAKRI